MSSKGSAAAAGERRAFWQAALELQRESGLTIRAFCKQEQLAESVFHFWKRELQRELPSASGKEAAVRVKPACRPAEGAGPAFVPVEIRSPAASPLVLVIELASGTKVSVHESCSRDLLQNVLEALQC